MTNHAQGLTSCTGAVPRWVTVIFVVLIAALMIAENNGILVGYSNHTGLLPVARRIADPSYLSGDFTIEMRQYHHRSFAQIVAWCSQALGEKHGLIALHTTGILLLSWGLFSLCASLELPALVAVVAGLLIAREEAGIGIGAEQNTFLGLTVVMPPLFAHATVLFTLASLVRGRFRHASFFTGLTVFAHVQVGIILTAATAIFYLPLVREKKWKELGALAVLYLLPASPSLYWLWRMAAEGISHGWDKAYIEFRHPHHYRYNAGRISTVLKAFAYLAITWGVLRWRGFEMARKQVGVPLIFCTALLALSGLHYMDYHITPVLGASKFQFIRLTPFVTVLATLAVLKLVSELAGAYLPERLRRIGGVWLALAVLVAVATPSLVEKRGRFYQNAVWERTSNWETVCRWIRDNTPADARFITPPNESGFIVTASRSNIAEFRINPDGAYLLQEWYERLADLTGTVIDPAQVDSKTWDKIKGGYDGLSAGQVIALSQKYGASYAVLSRDREWPFEKVFEDGRYMVVRLAKTSPSGQQ